MLFAVHDYLNYVFKRGPYSTESLEIGGGRLATKENFPNLKDVKVPSILFCHTRISLLSWLVMYYTNGMWSHTAAFLQNGVLLDCTTSGVIKHSAENYLDNKSYINIHHIEDMPEEQVGQYLLRAESTVGGGFNWFGVLHFGFNIVTGNHEDWRLKHSLDIMFLMFAVSLLGPSAFNLSTFIGTAYVVFVAFNLIRRKVKKEKIHFIKENEPNQGINAD